MKKVNIPMLMALVLLGLTLVSSHFTSGLYAKYTSNAEGKDQARVAQFKIETDLDYITLGIAEHETPILELGGELQVTSVVLPFYIESRSEVSTVYSVKADFGRALPGYVTLTLSDGTKSQSIMADGMKTSFEFQDFGTMEIAANNQAVRRDLVLTISVIDAEQIVEEFEVPTAMLTVKVDQQD